MWGEPGPRAALLITRCLHLRKTGLGERRGFGSSLKLGYQTRLVRYLRNKVNSRVTGKAMGSARDFARRQEGAGQQNEVAAGEGGNDSCPRPAKLRASCVPSRPPPPRGHSVFPSAGPALPSSPAPVRRAQAPRTAFPDCVSIQRQHILLAVSLDVWVGIPAPQRGG